MVGLRTVLVILVTLICRELASQPPFPPLTTSAIALAGMVLGVGVLFRTFAIVALCRQIHESEPLRQQLGRHRDLTEWTWCILLPFALLATGWTAHLRVLEQSGPAVLAFVGYFLPTLCVILLVEFTFAEFEETIDEMSCSALAGARRWRPSRLQRMATRLKLGEMASMMTCILPVIMMILFRDGWELVAQWFLPAGQQPESLPMIVAAGLTFPIMAIFYPLWMSRMVGAIDLRGTSKSVDSSNDEPGGTDVDPGERWLAERIQQLLRRLRIGKLRMQLIPSQNRWSGAAVVGWFPVCRCLWLGDRLIQDLTREELDMVVLHELAHVRRKHFLWRVAPLLIIGSLLLIAWLGTSQTVAQRALQLDSTRDIWLLLGWGAMAAVMIAAMGWIARVSELDADRTACELAADSCDWTQGSRHTAAHLLASALVKVYAPSASGGSWLHPGLRQRLHNLGIEHS